MGRPGRRVIQDCLGAATFLSKSRSGTCSAAAIASMSSTVKGFLSRSRMAT